MLFTKCKDITWERIVHLFVNENDDLKTYVNDNKNCKLIMVNSGFGTCKLNDKSIVITAPMLFCLNSFDKLHIIESQSLRASVLYFKPSTINDCFTIEKLAEGYFNDKIGSTLYQDLILLQNYYYIEKEPIKFIKISTDSTSYIEELLKKIKEQLVVQPTSFWPCRSRAYFMELLYFINYTICENEIINNSKMLESEEDLVNKIICYLNEHMTEKILLDHLCKQFMLNRNKLNELFKKFTGMTSIAYLNKSRIDFSSILLFNTELTVLEISDMVGFNDVNHFIKVFKKVKGCTPSQYRKNQKLCYN